MSKIKQYEMSVAYDQLEYFVEAVEDSGGEYVLYKDHLSQITTLKQTIKELREGLEMVLRCPKCEACKAKAKELLAKTEQPE